MPPFAVVLLHAIGISSTLGYGIHHLFSETLIIGILLLTSGISGICSLVYLYYNRDRNYFFVVFGSFLGLALVLSSYFHGYRGLLFVFPFTASLFYFMRFKTALLLALALSIVCLLAALHVMENIVVLRYGAALIISIGFSACYAYVMNEQKAHLEQDAHYDSLTGITNRRYFNHWLNSVIDEKPSSKKNIALFYIDIDDFKHINDGFGHAAGDELLKLFSKRILAVIRQNELIMATNKIYNFARLAGDEFVIAILDLDNINAAKRIAERLIESTSVPFNISSTEIDVHISIGVIYSENYMSAEMLVHNADTAMYRAKTNGKNNFYIYDDSISAEIQRRKDIETNITQALDKQLFKLEYMPIYDITATPSITGVETLIRSNQDYLRDIGPDKFIPVAEASGQIKDIDLWVMETTFRDISSVQKGADQIDRWYAINISSTELLDSKFIDQIEYLLEKYSIDPKMIHLEITETKLVPYENIILDRLNRLRKLNFHLTLDDYGTGYTGFAQLLNFPGDFIKIDQSFIAEINQGNSNYTKMIGVMLSIANIYGLKVVAEGVETKEQLNYLQDLGCQYAQGYYFSRPLSWQDFSKL